MEIDDSDYVVKEIPVYLCKELLDNLYLFQFPCRLAEPNTTLKNITSCRIKPQNGIIELDSAIKTDSKYYNKYAGEEFAAGGSEKSDPKEQTSKYLNKITLQAQRNILKKDISCYSIATLHDGKFCISSLHDSVSFLPIYDHVEKSEKAKTRSKNTYSSDSESSSEEDESPAVQVTVKFAQRSLDKSKISQEASHQQYIAKLEEEPWCQSTYFNNTSPTALTTLSGLSKTVSRKVIPMLSLTEKEYSDVLVPAATDDIISQDTE